MLTTDDLLARAELVRCAARVASLDIDTCPAYQALEQHYAAIKDQQLKDLFVFEARGEIEVKGKGNVEAWLLRL